MQVSNTVGKINIYYNGMLTPSFDLNVMHHGKNCKSRIIWPVTPDVLRSTHCSSSHASYKIWKLDRSSRPKFKVRYQRNLDEITVHIFQGFLCTRTVIRSSYLFGPLSLHKSSLKASLLKQYNYFWPMLYKILSSLTQ